ncbi:hypothetical protein BDB00DRAFT_852186 [Zychaea mexicana]|uniref:uncharacterized protein n=1 Tax=Zychaea mexicana TaxID=64656 RepID=UPI0022FE40EA|nr:uncharacterized protein BDB00DRAFT_852186 [Zychaea mexicana]KAI9484980.1 hypothetical protein BDB00DRAFT_852186 [Zychaea mexicana]
MPFVGVVTGVISSEIRSGMRREHPWMSFSLNIDGGFITVWAGNLEVMDAILDLQLVEGMSVVCQGEVKLSRRRKQDRLFNTYVSMSALQLRRGVQWQVELEGDSGYVDSNPVTNKRVLKRLRHTNIVPRELTGLEKARIDTLTAAATVETFDEFGGKEQQFFDSFILSLEYNSNKSNNNNNNNNDYNDYNNDDNNDDNDNNNDNNNDNDNNDNNDNKDDNNTISIRRTKARTRTRTTRVVQTTLKLLSCQMYSYDG